MWIAIALPQVGPPTTKHPPIPPAAPRETGPRVRPPTYKPTWSLILPAATHVTLAAATHSFFVGMDSGPLAAYSLANGLELWTAPLSPDVDLVAGDDLVFVAEGDVVHAIDQTTGEQRWVITTGPLAVAPTWQPGWLFTASKNGVLTAWRAGDASRVWEQALGSPAAAPIVADGSQLFVPLSDNRLVSLNVIDGQPGWQITLIGAGRELVAAGGRVLLGTTAQKFYCIKQDTGELQWPVHRRITSTVVGHPVLSERYIWIATLDNRLSALSRRNGAIDVMQTLNSRPEGQILIEGGQVIVPLSSGEIMMFDERDAKPSTSPTAPPPAGSPEARARAAEVAKAAAAGVPVPPPPFPPTFLTVPTGTKLAAPIVLAGEADAPQLLRVTLYSDTVHTVQAFQRLTVPAPPPQTAP